MPLVRAEDVILEVLRVTNGEWTGKTKLFKAFYFAHLYCANKRPELLTDWPIARMPEGPGIDKSAQLFGGMVKAGFLTIEHVHEGPYPEFRYRLTEKGSVAADLPADAREAIKDAALFCKDKTAAELTQITHERSRSWIEGKDGEALNVYVDTIPDDEYEKRGEEIKRLEEQLAHVFGRQQA